MDGMNQFDAWIALSKDRTNRHLNAVKITQVTSELQERQPVRRTWLAQRTGRIFAGRRQSPCNCRKPTRMRLRCIGIHG